MSLLHLKRIDYIVHDKNGNINGGRVCTYRDGKRECIDNIALSNVSMKEKNLLVGMQNLFRKI